MRDATMTKITGCRGWISTGIVAEAEKVKITGNDAEKIKLH